MEAFFFESMESYVGSMELYRAKPISDLTTNEYNAMLIGLVNGVIQGEGLTEIETCATDAESEAHDAFFGFEALWQKQWALGFEKLGAVAMGFPQLMTDCKSTSEDIATIESWATVFESPASLPGLVKTNVTHNLIKLTRDLKHAKTLWSDEQYYAFGTQLGEMLVIATQPLSANDF